MGGGAPVAARKARRVEDCAMTLAWAPAAVILDRHGCIRLDVCPPAAPCRPGDVLHLQSVGCTALGLLHDFNADSMSLWLGLRPVHLLFRTGPLSGRTMITPVGTHVSLGDVGCNEGGLARRLTDEVEQQLRLYLRNHGGIVECVCRLPESSCRRPSPGHPDLVDYSFDFDVEGSLAHLVSQLRTGPVIGHRFVWTHHHLRFGLRPDHAERRYWMLAPPPMPPR